MADGTNHQILKLVDPLPERYKCKGCDQILVDPIQTKEGLRMCYSCYCSTGRDMANIFPDKCVRKEINQLKCHCPNGCGWQNEKGKLEEHLRFCMKQIWLCPFGCKRKIPADEFKEHCLKCMEENNELKTPYPRVLNCKLVMASSSLQHLCNGSLDSYKKSLVLTPPTNAVSNPALNPPTKDVRNLVELPQIEADDRKVDSDVGTIQRVLLSSLLDHRQVLRIQLPEYIERKIPFHSAPFFSKNGYKFFMKVFLNGNGEGEGTHISVHFALMKHRNDERLDWPFPHCVNIKLLKLDDDERSCMGTIEPAANAACFQRPVEAINEPFKLERFLSLDQLPKFIYNHNIFIEVTVTNRL